MHFYYRNPIMVSKKYNKKQNKNHTQKKHNKKHKKRHGGDGEAQSPESVDSKSVEKEKPSKGFLCGIPVVSSLVGFFGMCKEPESEEYPKSTSTSKPESDTSNTQKLPEEEKEEQSNPPTTVDEKSDSDNPTKTESLEENKTQPPEPIKGGKKSRKTRKSRKSKK